MYGGNLKARSKKREMNQSVASHFDSNPGSHFLIFQSIACLLSSIFERIRQELCPHLLPHSLTDDGAEDHSKRGDETDCS